MKTEKPLNIPEMKQKVKSHRKNVISGKGKPLLILNSVYELLNYSL